MNARRKQWLAGPIIMLATVTGLIGCSDAPLTTVHSPIPRQSTLAAAVASATSAMSSVRQVAPNVTIYGGLAADSFLEHHAQDWLSRGDERPAEQLREMRAQLRSSLDSVRGMRPRGFSAMITPDDGGSSPPPPAMIVISPTTTSQAKIFDATTSAQITGTDGIISGSAHIYGMSLRANLKYGAKSQTGCCDVSDGNDVQDILGPAWVEGLNRILYGEFNWDQTVTGAVAALHGLLTCGMDVKGGGSYVAYWGFPNGNAVQVGNWVTVTAGTWGYSPIWVTTDKHAQSAAACTPPGAALTVSDGYGHSAASGGTLNTTAPSGGTVGIVLDASRSTAGNTTIDSYTFKVNGVDVTANPAASTLAYTLPIGTSTVSATVKNHSGLTASATVTVAVTIGEDSSDPTGGGGDETPHQDPQRPSGGWVCEPVYRWDQSFYDPNTDTGYDVYVYDHDECHYESRNLVPVPGTRLSLNVTSGSPPLRRITVALVDSLPGETGVGWVLRSGTQTPLMLVNVARLTPNALDLGLTSAAALASQVNPGTGTKDLVYVPRRKAPAISSGAKLLKARSLVSALQNAPLIDVPGLGRRRGLTVDLATRTLVTP